MDRMCLELNHRVMWPFDTDEARKRALRKRRKREKKVALSLHSFLQFDLSWFVSEFALRHILGRKTFSSRLQCRERLFSRKSRCLSEWNHCRGRRHQTIDSFGFGLSYLFLLHKLECFIGIFTTEKRVSPQDNFAPVFKLANQLLTCHSFC